MHRAIELHVGHSRLGHTFQVTFASCSRSLGLRFKVIDPND